MARVATSRIRNVVLVGHQRSGKTSLVDALLLRSGAIGRLGRVEDGTTVCDSDPEEQQRGISMALAVAPFQWKGYKINVIDTPGYPDFAGDVTAALRMADLAVFVVSATDGVEVQTKLYWREADALGTPRMVFVNKLDRERADLDVVLADLQENFGRGFVVLELPIGHDASFRGVADVLAEKTFVFDHGAARESGLPPELADRERELHDQLVEGIVVADDELLEQYLDGEVPDLATLELSLARGVAECTAFPVLCGSAIIPIGVDQLADFICELGPSPLDRPVSVAAGDLEVQVPADSEAATVVFVAKTVVDQYVGRVSLFRVLSGTVRRDDHLVNSRTGESLRLHELLEVRGGKHHSVDEVAAGDIGAVAKLHGVITGDTLAVVGRPVRAQPIAMPDALLGVAIVPSSSADDDKLATALHRLADEDPVLRIVHDLETQQTVIYGVGVTHLQLTIDRLARKFGVHVETHELAVPYRETVSIAADAEARHKKQSGGHGQFGVVRLRIEPLERGAGIEFASTVTGGAVPRAYVTAVQAGVEEALAHGGVFGHPVVDVKVTLLDGKEHSADSSEMAFRAAGRLGVQAAIKQAQPVLLEPVDHVVITAPVRLQGEVISDVNGRRGVITGSTTVGDEQVIDADVPHSELLTYATQLRSITSGLGRFRVGHARYEPAPPHVAEAARRQFVDAAADA